MAAALCRALQAKAAAAMRGSQAERSRPKSCPPRGRCPSPAPERPQDPSSRAQNQGGAASSRRSFGGSGAPGAPAPRRPLSTAPRRAPAPCIDHLLWTQDDMFQYGGTVEENWVDYSPRQRRLEIERQIADGTLTLSPKGTRGESQAPPHGGTAAKDYAPAAAASSFTRRRRNRGLSCPAPRRPEGDEQGGMDVDEIPLSMRQRSAQRAPERERVDTPHPSPLREGAANSAEGFARRRALDERQERVVTEYLSPSGRARSDSALRDATDRLLSAPVGRPPQRERAPPTEAPGAKRRRREAQAPAGQGAEQEHPQPPADWGSPCPRCADCRARLDAAQGELRGARAELSSTAEQLRAAREELGAQRAAGAGGELAAARAECAALRQQLARAEGERDDALAHAGEGAPELLAEALAEHQHRTARAQELTAEKARSDSRAEEAERRAARLEDDLQRMRTEHQQSIAQKDSVADSLRRDCARLIRQQQIDADQYTALSDQVNDAARELCRAFRAPPEFFGSWLEMTAHIEQLGRAGLPPAMRGLHDTSLKVDVLTAPDRAQVTVQKLPEQSLGFFIEDDGSLRIPPDGTCVLTGLLPDGRYELESVNGWMLRFDEEGKIDDDIYDEMHAAMRTNPAFMRLSFRRIRTADPGESNPGESNPGESNPREYDPYASDSGY